MLCSPAGREGVGLSQFLLVTLRFFAPALIQRCGSIRFFRYLNPLSSHILSTQRRACLHSLHYVPPIPLRYIKLHCIHSFDKPSSDPAKETSLHAKTPPALLRLPPCSLRCATLRTPCQPPSLHSQRLRLTLRRQGKHSAIATPLSHRLVAQGCFPSRWGKRCFDPKLKNLLKTKSRPKVYYLFSSTLDKPQFI